MDFVIVKSDGIPVYNFAVVMDDHMMGITALFVQKNIYLIPHVKWLFYEALGWEIPKFGHISLILGKDYKKCPNAMVLHLLNNTNNWPYLPEALVNFLALLGLGFRRGRRIFHTR